MPWKPRWTPGVGIPLPPHVVARIIKTPTCWLWSGAHSSGYAQTSWKGRPRYLHRVAYQSAVGAIPEGYEIDHLCRNRGCVNPAHLEAVTPLENLRRQAAARVPPARCRHGHPFTSENRRSANGGRTTYCVVCARKRRKPRD